MVGFGLGFLAGVGERGTSIQIEREKERQRRFDSATEILTQITLPAIEKDRAAREERIRIVEGVARRTGQSIRKAHTALEAGGYEEKNRAAIIQDLIKEPQDIRNLSIDEQIEELRRKTPSAQRQNPAEFFVQEKRSKASRTVFGGGFTQQDAQAVGRAAGLPAQTTGAQRTVVQSTAGESAAFSREIPIELDPKVRDVLVERAAAIEDDQLRGNILSRLGSGVSTSKELDIITAEITRAEKVKPEIDLKDLSSSIASVKDISLNPQVTAAALVTGDVVGFIASLQPAPKGAQLIAGTPAFTRELRSAVVSTANLPFKTSTNAAGEIEFIFAALTPSEQIKADALIFTANSLAVQAEENGKQLNANSFAEAAKIAIASNNSFLDRAANTSEDSDKYTELVVSEIDRAITSAQADYIREKANEKIKAKQKLKLSPQNRVDIQDAVDAKRRGISREELISDRMAATISSLGQTEGAQTLFDSLPSEIQQRVLQILSEEQTE